MFNKVDFPHPEGPSKETISLSFIDKEMFFKTSTSFFLEKDVLFKEEIVRRFSIKISPNLKYVSYKKMRIK